MQKDITLHTSKLINNDIYSINEIKLTVRENDLKQMSKQPSHKIPVLLMPT